MDYIISFFKEFLFVLNEMSPYLLLGFLFAGLLHVFIPENMISKYMGKSNARSAFNASLLGVPLPLCSCGVIPTGVSLYKNGASKSSTISFLISTPQTGVDSILATYSLLGLPFAIIRPFVALFTGIFGGIVANFIEKDLKSNQPTPLQMFNTEKPERSISALFKYAFVDFLQDISNWLVIGLLLAATISVILPDNFFQTYIDNDLLSMLIILVGAIPLYVCATGSIPIAAVLIMKGLSPGAALVFLMAGPATNLATITVLNNVMGKKALFSYLSSIIIGSLLFGFLINSFMPAEWFALSPIGHMGSHEHQLLPMWLKVTSSIILSLLILNGYVKKYIIQKIKMKSNKTKIKEELNMETINISVKGMTCNHCKMSVEKGLGSIKNIENVEVNLANDLVAISGNDIDLKDVEKKVNELGFTFARKI